MSKEGADQKWTRKPVLLRDMLLDVEECVEKLEDSLEDNDVLEAMVMVLKEEIVTTIKALNTRIEELERELALCLIAIGNEVSSAALKCEDVPKSKAFTGQEKSTDKRQNEIGMWQEFQCTVGEYVREFKKLMLQILDMTEKETLLAFKNGLKPWDR
ncbi:hypothetical protein Golob_005664 [Gossypium lobatum]|uniref:Uncharacterized protein n=1 Tax=Gossypium lobatum TaxID=34289 RepID=A0A7J8MTY5_9ROSI|nr:hypothetical protein [Gossypium lobatum]